MKTPPQAVTLRYVRNLLAAGENRDFRILGIRRDIAFAEEVPVGVYYRCTLQKLDTEDCKQVNGIGMTPGSSVADGLTKLGVTFR